MNLDDLEGLDEATREEIEELQKVTRGKDKNNKFFEAQYDIAQLLRGNELFKNAHSILRKLKKDAEDVGNFRWQHAAQFDIGAIFLEVGDTEKAIWTWQRTKDIEGKSEDPLSQVLVGKILRDQEDLEGAEKAWEIAKKLGKSNRPKFNSEIRLLLGQIFEERGDSEKALKEWSEIKYENDKSRYAKAQFNIGNMFFKQDAKEDALISWRKVKCEDNPEVYIKAQFNIDKIIENMDIHKRVFKKLELKRKWILSNKDEIKKAFSEWDVVNSPKDYAYSKLKFGEKNINSSEDRDIKNAIASFEKAKECYAYESYTYLLICELLSHSKSEQLGKLTLEIFNKVQEIIDILSINFSSSSIENIIPERKLAHYTSTDTVDKLLNTEDGKKSSSFRLNTINNVNDPSEGQLLLNHLKNIKDTSSYTPEFDEKYHAFLSCFTFNHDSLNQFRLYGKKDNKEASGVSIVFKKDFFEFDSSILNLPFPLFESGIKSSDDLHEFRDMQKKPSVITENIDFKDSDFFNIKKNNEDYFKIRKQPVMRCVYLDPTSNYIHLAQRNRLTFFREFNDETVQAGSEKISKAEHEWKSYKSFIDKKTDDFSIAFTTLKTHYKAIDEEMIKIEEINSRLINNIKILLNEILLPLKYLIKHSAFQEEQECRMVYITHLDRPEIKMDFGKFLYVEYEPEVKAHLDKIYIAPAASHYEPYFAKLLCGKNGMGKKIKIESSNNPYRQT
ncbi:tetratricopeptide repeat protein [Psychrobacter sp. S1-30-MNA-CIBAN-0213]|uniref:tetratricopeptide repeat protein n=1 Tax=unclassified Psychrobacter TaxID=196806 RepID=UPI00331EBAE4